MDKNFDSNFYVTTATVIPVLYVALAAQFALLDRVAIRFIANISLGPISRAGKGGPRIPRTRKSWFFSVLTYLMILFIGAVILFSLIGEVQSLLALYRQSDNNATKAGVLRSVIGLVVCIVVGPLWTLLVIMVRFMVVPVLRSSPYAAYAPRWMQSLSAPRSHPTPERSISRRVPHFPKSPANAAYVRRIQHQAKVRVASKRKQTLHDDMFYGGYKHNR